MSIEEKLASNALYLFLDRLVITLFSFLFWFFLAKTISVSDYGIVAVSINFITIISMFSTFGIGMGLAKLIPEFVAKKKIGIANSYVWSSFKIISLIVLFLSILLFIFSHPLSRFFKLPYNAFLLIVLSILSITMYNFFGSVVYGFQRMKKYFISDGVGYLFKLIITVFLVLLGFNYLGPLVAVFIGYIVISLIRIDSSYFSYKNPVSYNKLFYYSFPALIISVAGAVFGYGHYIILTILKNIDITGIFALAFTISNIIIIFPSVFSFALFPIMSSLSIKKKVETLQGYLVGLILRYSLFVVIPLSIGLILFSKYAVLLFSRPDYISAARYFPILIPASVFSSLASTFNLMFYAIGKPNTHRNITVATSILFLFISIPLTFYLSAIGMSIAYLLSALFAFLTTLFFITKYMKVHFFTSDILKIIVSSIIFSSLLYFLKPFIQNIFMLLIILVPSIIVYIIILFLLRFYRVEDVKILKFILWKIPYMKNIVKLFSRFVRK